MTTCRKIVNWRTYLRFPPEAEAALTPAARDLILRLLCDVEERLGSAGGAAEVRAHPFFAGVAWGALYQGRPPYRPVVEHELDTQVGWVGWEGEGVGVLGVRGKGGRDGGCDAAQPLQRHHAARIPLTLDRGGAAACCCCCPPRSLLVHHIGCRISSSMRMRRRRRRAPAASC